MIGSVIHSASELNAPGWIKPIERDDFPVSELDGSERARRVFNGLIQAGSKAPVLLKLLASSMPGVQSMSNCGKPSEGCHPFHLFSFGSTLNHCL